MDRSLRRLVTVAGMLGGIALSAGCATTGEFSQTFTAPLGADDGDERAYDLGHRLGRRDAAQERAPDYALHRKAFDPGSEQAFAAGYRDGYAGRGNRNGSPDTRDWLYGRSSDPDAR